MKIELFYKRNLGVTPDKTLSFKEHLDSRTNVGNTACEATNLLIRRSKVSVKNLI